MPPLKLGVRREVIEAPWWPIPCLRRFTVFSNDPECLRLSVILMFAGFSKFDSVLSGDFEAGGGVEGGIYAIIG